MKPGCLLALFTRLESGLCARPWEADQGKKERAASTVIIATCSVSPPWILDSLFLVAWLKEGYDELKLVKVGETGLWVANQESHRNPAGQVL